MSNTLSPLADGNADVNGRQQPDAVVVGAGPAGLMAAQRLAMAGNRVIVCERMAAPARKLLLAGRGGLNLTHGETLETFLDRYGAQRAALEPAIRAFPPPALVAWAQALGQETFVGSSGRVFPRAMKASPLLRAWLRRLAELGVELRPRYDWRGWDEHGALLFATPAGPVTLHPRATVLALGGASWPRLGSNGDWVAHLQRSGIGVIPLQPANCGVQVPWSAHMMTRFAGAPLKRIALQVDTGTPRSSDAAPSVRGEAIVTKAGLEGGAVYALVPTLRAALQSGAPAVLSLDLRPDLTVDDLARRLARPRGKLSLGNFLRKAAALPPVAVALLHESQLVSDSQSAADTLPADAMALARRIKAVRLPVSGLAGIDRAISTAGGVAFSSLDDGLMTAPRAGVFVAGEMLDWEAPTGGYLLQACFATGYVAGEAATAWLSRSTPPPPGAG